MFSKKQRNKRFHLWLLGGLLFVLIVVVGIAAFVYQRIQQPLFLGLQQGSDPVVAQTDTSLMDLAPTLLGFREPHTYLVLFLNNTELRPAGGFIGSYAVLTVEKGKMQVDVMQGSEVLDWETPDDWQPEPPTPIRDYLGVDRWYFRDANWNPDFAKSAERVLSFYAGEGGVKANEIDSVVGVTPDVLIELLAAVGPIAVDDVVLTADNATQVLQYDVWYGYKERDIAVPDRKQIIKPLMVELLQRTQRDVFRRLVQYRDMLLSLADEKQILFYSKDALLQQTAEQLGWAGRMVAPKHDYLQWVDANLAALKTDHAMERALYYTVGRNATGTLVATTTMRYEHTGTFDWRTTRYLSYARVFAPVGAELVRVVGGEEEIGRGSENGNTWFGRYVRIEPGTEETLSFHYTLPPRIEEQIADGEYELLVQKQAGTTAHALTLDLPFGITDGSAGEKTSGIGLIQSDLRVDRVFQINEKNSPNF